MTGRELIKALLNCDDLDAEIYFELSEDGPAPEANTDVLLDINEVYEIPPDEEFEWGMIVLTNKVYTNQLLNPNLN